MFHLTNMICVLILLSIAGCATTADNDVLDKRNAIHKMENTVLTQLYKLKPEVKEQIKKSPGYAVFSSANVNILMISFGGGYGVVNNNYSHERTYMKMGEAGVGPGLGIKDFRAVFVFHSVEVMDSFVEYGWTLGAHIDAAVKFDEQGVATGGSVTVGDITVYEMTQSGLTLQATLQAKKFWRDDYLN
jgi:lipid-binding SYLF domain-containing protein